MKSGIQHSVPDSVELYVACTCIILRVHNYSDIICCFRMYRENDVAGIDVNMGCPKDYSVKVCMILFNWHLGS